MIAIPAITRTGYWAEIFGDAAMLTAKCRWRNSCVHLASLRSEAIKLCAQIRYFNKICIIYSCTLRCHRVHFP